MTSANSEFWHFPDLNENVFQCQVTVMLKHFPLKPKHIFAIYKANIFMNCVIYLLKLNWLAHLFEKKISPLHLRHLFQFHISNKKLLLFYHLIFALRLKWLLWFSVCHKTLSWTEEIIFLNWCSELMGMFKRNDFRWTSKTWIINWS